MPRGDGTGPRGMGSMTGRGAGYCAGAGMPGYANPAPGWGRGFWGGRGGGHGWRNCYYATGLPGWMRAGHAPAWGAPPAPAPEQEVAVLNSQARGLRAMLEQIDKRLHELEGEEG